ncbi:CotH kinase family protein [uncultured Oscillibacter sp.]|uniref:CotH kinase family protein n=1 Tax=uncultured Oscillibacter sp. TaxID=876091 RepID=UPI00217351A3|nr:CotH kinase family protein [uncultured Oscillibacter sp.]MCI9012257.1 spore coat protein CotH [Oscillibacter sp.]
MSTHKYVDKLCAAALVLCLLLTFGFMNGEALGIRPAASVMGYETRLFDTEQVHTIDIVMDGWDGFLETCENEEYAQCAVVIDGEAYQNTAIRAKGNTSLTMVSSMDSDRYSFKLEFDHYDSGRTYYGLDKLSLNNIIQDTTYMKDYLTYQMMGAFGVDAPLCSYVYITVNGQDWGLYLAVEGVEDGFLRRNYGSDSGELYKPDSMSFGGGRGNGREFDMKNVMDFSENGSFPSPPEAQPFDSTQNTSESERHRGGGPGGGMGSDDVKLRYIDDDPDSYSNIFQNAKTDITKADQARLIASLKALSEGESLEGVLDIDKVLRYFVVHNFVRNGDSYTGSMVHNYYLYEEEGRLSMIPWDYNLAYGTFQGGDAGSEVNAPIDTPVSGGDSRPMVDWIFDSQEYTALYHQYFQEFLETVDTAGLIDTAAELIAPYVEKDPTRFYTYEEFETGMETLRTFCRLRAESIAGQLAGTIPSTEDGQAADASALVDASSITLSDMGTMDRGGFGGGERPSPPGGSPEQPDAQPPAEGPPGQSQEPPAIPAMEAQSVEILRQGSPGRPGGGFPGGEFPGEGPASLSVGALLAIAASLAALLVGICAALLYRRRKG